MHDHGEGVPAARWMRSATRRNSAGLAIALGLAIASAGCARDHSTAAVLGRERSDCRPDKSCDTGLICLSNLCVRPPPANCQAVAEQLTSIDLGNYAEPEDRAPVIARYKAACETAMVTKEEGQCLDKAREKWSAGVCVPRMFPELASSSTGDCAAIVDRVRAAMVKQASYLSDPKMKGWFDRTIAILQESCAQDHWPDSVKQCMLQSDAASLTTACNQQMPPALQQRLQERLTQAMQDYVR
jgi:hypothetical protein